MKCTKQFKILDNIENRRKKNAWFHSQLTHYLNSKGKDTLSTVFNSVQRKSKGQENMLNFFLLEIFAFPCRPLSKKRLHTKQTMIHFIVGNEQCFPLLLGTNNTFRIFMVLLETKSALVIKISQLHCLFIVWNSELANICFLGDLTFFWVTLLKFWETWLQLRWFSGNLTVNS